MKVLVLHQSFNSFQVLTQNRDLKTLNKELFKFNMEFAKQNNQKGIWLAVWIENKRAINFYLKMGFKKVGKFDFKISETHSNPNHILYLKF